MKPVPASLIIVVALALGACGSEDPDRGQPGGSLSGDWTLDEATVDGEPLNRPDDGVVTLGVADGEVSGTSACNSYFGTAAIAGSTVRFTGLGGTEMACEPDLMTLESAYLAALDRVREASNEADQLVLTGEGVELRFDPVQPVEPSALVGTRWVLESVVGAGGPDGSVSSVVGEPATLELTADGELTGSTGCNSLSARYEVVDDELRVTDTIYTTMACADTTVRSSP